VSVLRQDPPSFPCGEGARLWDQPVGIPPWFARARASLPCGASPTAPAADEFDLGEFEPVPSCRSRLMAGRWAANVVSSIEVILMSEDQD